MLKRLGMQAQSFGYARWCGVPRPVVALATAPRQLLLRPERHPAPVAAKYSTVLPGCGRVDCYCNGVLDMEWQTILYIAFLAIFVCALPLLGVFLSKKGIDYGKRQTDAMESAATSLKTIAEKR